MNLLFSLQNTSALNACDISWPLFLLGLLLPFLLGFLIARALWAKFKRISEKLEKTLRDRNDQIAKLEADLEICNKKRISLDSENARAIGEIKELKLQLEEEAKANMANAEELISLRKSSSSTNIETEHISQESLDLAKKIFGKKIKANDLKVIEGIGPKIESLLIKDGLDTWKKVAQSEAAHIKHILSAAGSRFQMHDPTTWPNQSKMAWLGKWQELKKWQDSHDSGKK